MTSSSGSAPKQSKLLKWIRNIDPNIRAAIIGAIIGAILTALFTVAIPSIVSMVNGHPRDDIVMNLMEQDIHMAKTHDLTPIQSVFANNAVVVDSGCVTAGQPTVWANLPNIEKRYESLPQIVTLDHSKIQVNWTPDDSSATSAVATAYTTGTAIENGSSFELKGNEVWEFTKIDGNWLVTSFTFDLC